MKFNPFIVNIYERVKKLSFQIKSPIKNIDRSGPIKIGLSHRTVQFQKNEMVLYKYENTSATKNNRPILLVYSLVNRPEIADLSSDRSLIKELCD